MSILLPQTKKPIFEQSIKTTQQQQQVTREPSDESARQQLNHENTDQELDPTNASNEVIKPIFEEKTDPMALFRAKTAHLASGW